MAKVAAKPGPDGSVLKDSAVLEAIDEDVQRPFDLVKGPLIRFLLIKVGEAAGWKLERVCVAASLEAKV